MHRRPHGGHLAGLLLAFILVAGPAGAGGPPWIAQFDQPCTGVPACSFHLELWVEREDAPRAALDAPSDGCGPQSVDISPLVDDVLEQLGPPGAASRSNRVQLRVWSVSCEGVRSASPSGSRLPGYDWAYIDLADHCGPRGTGSSLAGDSDQNARLDLTDGIRLLQYLFQGAELPCGDGDHNQDGRIDASDVVSILTELFL